VGTSWLVLARPAARAQDQPPPRPAAPAAQARTSVTDGVYTSEQAMRGQAIVESHCTECHGETLRGLEGPELVGRLFIASWNALTLGDLFRKTTEMPKDGVGRVTDRERIDAIAYLLQANGFPPGASELASDRDLLGRIAMGSTTNGPIPGAMVKATGCLTSGPGNQWVLTGEQPLRLMNVFPRPTAHVGKMVLVTGLFVRAPVGDALNVVSIEGAGRPCE
jgi:mono/diheme cytochrome c family protein